MGHAQSKRKKQRQGRARRRIEHVTHEQTRFNVRNQENQTSRSELQRNERRSAGKSGRWREPSPEKIDTLERRQREAVNRTKRNRSHSRDSRGRSPKRHSKSNLTNNLLENSKTQLQPRKMSSEKFQTLQRNSEAQRGRNFSRRSGTWFCVVRCRSEPPLDRESKVAQVRAPRKSASASPPRKIRRELELAPFYQNGLKPFASQKQQVHQKPSNAELQQRRSAESSATAVPVKITNYREDEGLARVDRSFQPRNGTENVISAAQHGEIGISFEQVEPKLFRLFGSSAKSGPIPQTNRVAPRALRRSFPNLTSQTSRKEHDLKPKQNFISRTAKDKSVSETRLQKLAAQHFPKPPIPPRKQKLSDLAHLVQQTSPKLTKHEPVYQHQTNINHNNQNHNYGSVETLNSLSSQSGSYHLPSSANFSTLPDRSLAESPHAVHLSDSAKISAYSDEDSEEDDDDALQIRTIPQTPPLTVAEKSYDPGGSRYSPEVGRKNLLWSNPAPFGSQPLQKVIRSVQAPIQKPQNLHWPPVNEFKPVQKFTPAGRYQKNSINTPPPVPLRPPQMNHQRNGYHEISVSPERLRVSPAMRERPRSEVQDRVYKDILFDNTERSSNLIKSGLPKTLRPSIEDLVSILAEPIPPRSKKSHRFQTPDYPSEENLINELKTEKKRPGILKNANTHSSSRVVEVLYHEPKSRKTPIHQESNSSRWSAPYDPPIFLGEDDFGNNWIDLTQPARNSYLNDDY